MVVLGPMHSITERGKGLIGICGEERRDDMMREEGGRGEGRPRVVGPQRE